VDIEDDNNYVLITNQGKKVTAEKLIIASHYPCYNKAGYTLQDYIRNGHMLLP